MTAKIVLQIGTNVIDNRFFFLLACASEYALHILFINLIIIFNVID